MPSVGLSARTDPAGQLDVAGGAGSCRAMATFTLTRRQSLGRHSGDTSRAAPAETAYLRGFRMPEEGLEPPTRGL